MRRCSPRQSRSPARPAFRWACVFFNLLDGVVSGRAAQRVGRQRPADIYPRLARLEPGRQGGHHIPPSAEPPGRRVSAGHTFTEYSQIGFYIEISLGTAQDDPEARYHFVKNQQGPELVTQCAHLAVVVRHHGPGRALRPQGFDDDGRRTAAVGILCHKGPQTAGPVDVVGIHFPGIFKTACRNTVGLEIGGTGNVQAEDHLVAPAVIRAAHLNDGGVAGKIPGRPNRGHDTLRAAAQHAEHLDIRHESVYQPGQFQFVLVKEPGNRSARLYQRQDFFLDRFVIAAQQSGTAGLQKVNVPVAVHIPQPGIPGFGNGNREWVIESQVVLNTAGNVTAGFRGQCTRLRTFFVEIPHDGIHAVSFEGPHGLADQLFEGPEDRPRIRPVRYGISS